MTRSAHLPTGRIPRGETRGKGNIHHTHRPPMAEKSPHAAGRAIYTRDMERERISLRGEKETLLITVVSKAQESAQPDPILRDPTAQSVLDRSDYDFEALKVPRKSSVMVAMRAKKLDDLVREFSNLHGSGVVINLGCGLDG